VRGFVVLLMAGSLGAAAAHAADWRMDPAGSKVEYVATVQKNRASGAFREFDTRARFDANRLADSQVEVTVVTASADMIDPDVNKTIRGPDWFDSARFPRAVFRASDVRRAQDGRYVARGTLTVKGIEQPVEIPFVWTTDADTATIAGELTLKRASFRIGLGEWASTEVVGPDVTVKFSVRLRRTD
jgi:polyisoprenoid-binding protein YceI